MDFYAILAQVRELLQRQGRVAMQPFDGYMAQYLGDGWLLYSGYPQAHEDAAHA